MDNSKTAVSVIIPVFNTEQYFDKMIGSVRNQSLKTIEIIVVNDCSQGNIETIVEEYRRQDSRIIYCKTPKNIGAGGARNHGMKYATGEYVMFCDSDDWLDLKTLEAMYIVAQREKADIVSCSFYRDYSNGEKKWDCFYDMDYMVDGETALKMLAHQYDYGVELCVSPANKIYRRHLIENIFFMENVYYEEALFNYQAIRKAHTLAFVKDGKYTYFRRPGSNLQSIRTKHIEDFNMVFSEIKRLMVQDGIYETHKNTYMAYLEYFMNILIEQIYESSGTEEERKKLVIGIIHSFDTLITLEEYIDYLGTERFRWNLQPLMMHNGERLL